MPKYFFNEADLYDMGFCPVESFGNLGALVPTLKADFPLVSSTKSSESRLPIYLLPQIECVFPGQFHTTVLDRNTDIELLKRLHKEHQILFVAVEPLKDLDDGDLRYYGCFASVLAVEADPYTHETKALFAFGERGELIQKDRGIGEDPELVTVRKSPDGTQKKLNEKSLALLVEIAVTYRQILEMIAGQESQAILDMLMNQPDNWILLNFIAMHTPGNAIFKQNLLAADVNERAEMIIPHLYNAAREMHIKSELLKVTSESMQQSSRDNFLRHQMQAIKTELGENSEENADAEELRKRASQKKWSSEVAAYFEKELAKMLRFNITMPEYSIQYSYLDTLLNLPWDKHSSPTFTLADVRTVLDKDHYGLEKVKERIVEHMAVHKLRGDMKAPILCLYGPPGVGKTSLGKSIAAALGREYHRVALGGVSDEAEIRGHRRTYVGAMAGRIMAAMAKCKEGNPLIVLDEIDKIGKGLRGDPAQALLELLDPEQNTAFHDNYIDVDYDLSKVFFIATANSLSTISEPLLDRMELIELTGYVIEEKIEIALRHLLPKCLRANGFQEDEISFEQETIRYIIENYTRESGVRQLEKKISAVLRKIACLKVDGKDYPQAVGIDAVRHFLGKEEVYREAYTDNSYPGVVTGLAWTSAGGEILFIETSLSPGKGDKITLTGKLGDVMKESALIALEYLKANAGKYGIDQEVFSERNLHIHVPEGAVPKDGPSAGIAMATSIASAFTKRKVRDKLAMTGEITLRGKVLPVGGIKEKILAAKRAGITDIILCDVNRRDVEEIPAIYLDGLTFHYVDTVSQVLDFALLDETAEL